MKLEYGADTRYSISHHPGWMLAHWTFLSVMPCPRHNLDLNAEIGVHSRAHIGCGIKIPYALNRL